MYTKSQCFKSKYHKTVTKDYLWYHIPSPHTHCTLLYLQPTSLLSDHPQIHQQSRLLIPNLRPDQRQRKNSTCKFYGKSTSTNPTMQIPSYKVSPALLFPPLSMNNFLLNSQAKSLNPLHSQLVVLHSPCLLSPPCFPYQHGINPYLPAFSKSDSQLLSLTESDFPVSEVI